MTSLRTMPLTFVGGELSQRMFGRPDDAKYQTGAALVSGFVVEPSGAARACPGTEFVAAARNANAKARLLTFRAPGGQSIFVQLGLRQEYPGTSTVPGYARFHALGGTLLHSQAWAAATAYAIGDVVASGGTHYRCRLAHTNQVPPNSTYWETLEYVANRSFPTTNVNLATNQITFSLAHGLETNEPIEFTNDGGVFPVANPIEYLLGGVQRPLVTGYAIVVDPFIIQVALTPGGAALDLVTQGTVGPHRMHRSYSQGELVSQSGSLWYVRTTRPIDPGTFLSIPPNAGNETYWYLQPASGAFEVPTTLAVTESELFSITHSQVGDTMTLACGTAAAGELRRVSAQVWTWSIVSLAQAISAPTGVAAAATKRGSSAAIATISVGSPLLVTTTTETNLVSGVDFVYIEGSAHAPLNNRYWGVDRSGGVAGNAFRPVDPETGQTLLGPGPGASVGTVRVSRLNSDDLNRYVVTAINGDGSESAASAEATVTNNLFVVGAQNTITWSAVAGAVRYQVYKRRSDSGLFGLLGTTEGLSFLDDGSVAPNVGTTPPIFDTSLANTAGNYPRAVTHFEGRRCFAGTDAAPQDVWLTKTNTESDLSYSYPIKDTDRIHERLKTRIACTIRHLIDLGQLVALSDTTEFRISPRSGDALTPSTFASRAQSFVGAAAVQPEIVQNVLVFAGARGGHVYQMAWRDDYGGYLTADLCERAAHLFDGYSIVQIAAQLAPIPIVWCLRSDGRLLGLTFVPSQQVWAWHQHATDGVIESVAVGGEGGEDRVMLMVQRTVGGSTVRYVERMGSLSPVAWNDSWHVDSGLRYSGPPVSSVTGLGHLEGRTVAVFADGLAQTPRTVTGATITLDAPASTVLAGLPRNPQLQTLPATFAIEAYAGGRPKSVSKVWVRVQNAGQFRIGATLSDMVVPPEITPGAPFSGVVEVRVPNEWTWDGQLFLELIDPVPMTIVSVTAEMAVGG